MEDEEIYETFDGEQKMLSELYWDFIKSVDMEKEFEIWKSAIIKQSEVNKER